MDTNSTINNLFALVRLGIETQKATDDDCFSLLNLSMSQWREVMALADRQGVAAIIFDGVQRLYEAHKSEIKATKENPQAWMQWVFECTGVMTQYEQQNLQQQKIISELAEIWHENGMKMMVFKGQANGTFYPNPRHRAPGDIDCYLFGEADRGDGIMVAHGADVTNNWYRHSKISFRGETIENHRVLGHTRGSKSKKRMERELVALLMPAEMTKIKGCGVALMPPAQFNAHFLIYHALHHFTSEGLRMKQILDWAVFLQAQQEEVDWAVFETFCKRYKLDRFAAVMNYIAVRYLGVVGHTDVTDNVAPLAEKVVKSTLYDDDYLFNSGKGDWTVRWLLVKNMLGRDRWKYESVAQESVWGHLWQSVMGFLSKEEE